MSLTHSVLVFNQTSGTVEFVPPDDELLEFGAPTAAATYAVYRGTVGDDDDTEFSGTATLDSVATTVDQASGFSQTNRRRIYLTATTNIANGRRYLATNTASTRTLTRPVGISSGDYVDVDRDLDIDLAVASTFKGIRHYFTVNSTFIQDESSINTQEPPYRIKWTYTTADSVQRIAWTTFDVARKRFVTGVGIDDVRPQMPDVIYQDWIQQRGESFDPQVSEALGLLRWDIRMAGYHPDQITDPEVAVQLHKQRTLAVIGLALDSTDREVRDWTKRQLDTYQSMFQQSIGTGLKAWIDTGSAGATDPDPPRQLWLRGR